MEKYNGYLVVGAEHIVCRLERQDGKIFANVSLKNLPSKAKKTGVLMGFFMGHSDDSTGYAGTNLVQWFVYDMDFFASSAKLVGGKDCVISFSGGGKFPSE